MGLAHFKLLQELEFTNDCAAPGKYAHTWHPSSAVLFPPYSNSTLRQRTKFLILVLSGLEGIFC